MAELVVYNTDAVADDVNYEFIGLRAAGASGFLVGTGASGTGVNRPLVLSSGALGGSNLTQFVLNVDGSTSLGGPLQPAVMADSGAPTNSIYYSTNASKLVYKDGSGAVNNLY